MTSVSWMKRSVLGAALLGLSLSGGLVGAARASAQDLAQAQASLTRYDLADPHTYEALATLRRVADANGPEAATARTVRAYAAIDLLVAATVLGDQTALSRLGDALGTHDQAAMSAMLDAELLRTRSGALAVAAREGRETLAAFTGRPATRSARNDAIVLTLAPADLAGLQARVHDRFDPVIDSTLEIVPEHANEVRRIIGAMRAMNAALHAAEAGDPLLLAIRPRIEATRARLGEIVVADPSFADIDVILTVHPDHLAFGYVPRTRVGLDGRPVLESGTPSLPATTSVAFPATLPPVIRPIEGLAGEAAITGARPGRVALRVEGDAQAHLVARVARSLEHTPLAITHLAVGDTRLAVTFVREDAVAADATRVQIRPGGYAIERHAGRRVDLPRRRVDGQWRFDREALVRDVPSGARVLTANPLAPAAELLGTAAVLATDGAITLVAP